MALPHQLKRDTPYGKMLTRYPAQPLADPGLTHGHPLRLEFDFIVAQRTKYIPGSGPPLAPIGILPEHNKYGIIEDFINLEGSPLYVVSYKDKPALRMSIKPEHVRDYVSARTLEKWEDKQTEIRLQAERDAIDPRARAKEERRLARESRTEARANPLPKKKQQPKKLFGIRKKRRGPGKGRKSSTTSMLGAGMGSGMLPTESAPSSPVHRSSYISPRRPSTSTPSKQRGLAEAIYSEPESEEGEDTSTALDRQLNGTPSTDSVTNSKLSKQNSPSETSSIRLPILARGENLTSKRNRRSTSISSREAASERDESVHDDKRRKIFDTNDAVASISSRAALEAYENLERNEKQPKTKSISERLNKPLLPRKIPAKVEPPKPAKQPKPVRMTLSQVNKARSEGKLGIETALPKPLPPKPDRVTKAQANKDRYDAQFGGQAAFEDPPSPAKANTAPAIPFHLRGSRSSSRDSRAPRRSERRSSVSRDNTPILRRSERPSSQASRDEEDTLGRRRSERSSSRISINYAMPPLLKPQDLEPEVEREPSEPEYDVEAIIGEKWRTIKGNEVLFYFIKWQGDWENTWEPANNVGKGSIDEWEKEKRRVEAKRTNAKVSIKEARRDSDEKSMLVARPSAARTYSHIPDFEADSDEI